MIPVDKVHWIASIIRFFGLAAKRIVKDIKNSTPGVNDELANYRSESCMTA